MIEPQNNTGQIKLHDPTGKATAALVLGLVGLIAWIIPLVGIIVTIIGITMAISGMKSSKKGIATYYTLTFSAAFPGHQCKSSPSLSVQKQEQSSDLLPLTLILSVARVLQYTVYHYGKGLLHRILFSL